MTAGDLAPISFTVPLPREGERASYRADDGGLLEFTVGGVQAVRDVTRRPVDSIPIHLVARFPNDHARISTMTEFLDESGRKVLVGSTCEGPGSVFDQPGPDGRVCKGNWMVVMYIEGGLPGMLGASGFVGRTLTAGETIPLSLSFMGRPQAANYTISNAPRDNGCATVRIESAASFPDLIGQRFSAFSDIADRAVFCSDSFFPRSVETRAGIYVRVSHTSGGAPLTAKGHAADVWHIPASTDARPVTQLGFPNGTYEPVGDDVNAAIEALLATDAGKTFKERESPLVFHNTNVVRNSRFTTGIDAVPPAIESTRTISLQGKSGNVLLGTVRTQCQLGKCEMSAEVEKFRPSDMPDASTKPVSIPVASVMKLANATLGGPVTFVKGGVAYTDVGRPDIGRGDELVYLFRANPEGGFGVPPLFAFRGANGAPLQVSGKAANVTAFTGITREMLEVPSR